MFRRLLLALAPVALSVVVAVSPVASAPLRPACEASPSDPPARKPIMWRRSQAVGSPSDGRLLNGVQLPAEGRHFFTWNYVRGRSPNRPSRRWGTARLIRIILSVTREYRRAHPKAARVGIDDLSRRRGGDFGPQYGWPGHLSHQNGLDVDVLYPRKDRLECAPRRLVQIDRRLAQDLVDRFLAAGAVTIFVGSGTGLGGHPAVGALPLDHDDHFHVRIAPG